MNNNQKLLVLLIPIIVGIFVVLYPFGDTEDLESQVQIEQLFESNWILQSIMIDDLDMTGFEFNGVSIRFDEDGQAEGSGGCNGFTAPYQYNETIDEKQTVGGNLSFGRILRTAMACGEPENIMGLENRFFHGLDITVSFQLMPNSLTLFNGNERFTLNFKSE